MYEGEKKGGKKFERRKREKRGIKGIGERESLLGGRG